MAVHKYRLFAHPSRPNSYAAGGNRQVASSSPAATATQTPAGSATATANATGGVPSVDSQVNGQSTLIGSDFIATAYGPPWVGIQGTGVTADGTDLRPAKQIYGVAVDPSVIPLGTYLNIQPNPFNWSGTFKAFDTGSAIKGRRIDFYDWRGRTKQVGWGSKRVSVYRAPSQSTTLTPPPSGGGITLPSLSGLNPLKGVDKLASDFSSFVSLLLSPKQIGDLLAKVAAYFLKTFFKALWQYVIAPVLHWQQRAAQAYYTDTILDKSGLGGFVTFSFWATGFGILWANADDAKSLATSPVKTPLGSLINSFGNSRARRKLIKPKDVKKETPTKPTPVDSRATLRETRTLAVRRPRTVRVETPPVEGVPAALALGHDYSQTTEGES